MRFWIADEDLLRISQGELARIPLDDLDVQIVDEIGKTVSGSGMDLNAIGHWRATGKGPQKAKIGRIVALSLTGPSLGIGLADFTMRRFMEAYDPEATYINLLAATEPDGTIREGPAPLALDSDRKAMKVATAGTRRCSRTCGSQRDGGGGRAGRADASF